MTLFQPQWKPTRESAFIASMFLCFACTFLSRQKTKLDRMVNFIGQLNGLRGAQRADKILFPGVSVRVFPEGIST